MVIYLYGPDSYRRQEKAREIVEKFKAKYSGFTLDHFRLSEDGECARLKDFVSVQSIFGGAKLAVVHAAEEGGREFADLLKANAEDKATTIVINAEAKLPKDFAFLEKSSFAAYAFDALSASQLLSFLRRESEKRGVALSGDDAQALINLFPSDTWGLVNELEKMALGAGVREVFSRPAFFPIAQTLQGGSDPGRRLSALAYALEFEEPAAVFHMIASLVGSERKVAMADYDVRIKSGELDYPEALLDLALS